MPLDSRTFDLVVVAASLGGLETLGRILGPLPADFPVPIAVVQHLPAGFASQLPALLGRDTRLGVRWAEPGLLLRAGTVHVAPPDRHLLVSPTLRCRFSVAPRGRGARPAADLLFRSAAEACGARVLGLVLTGRLRDGAAGAVALRAAGAVVIAQDPATCHAPGMPTAAITAGGADLVLSPEAIVEALLAVSGAR